MTSRHNCTETGTNRSAPVPLALEQSKELKEKVEECAEDIGATNAAMQSRIAEGATTLSAPKALAEGQKVERKVQEVADDLHKVTETLAHGVEELKQLELELSTSRLALAESVAALTISTEAEQESKRRSLHDSTTGLPNRDLFDARLEQAISMAKRHHWTLAVMFFDLDRFKSVNDIHGHAAGDAVLLEIANRLVGHVRDEDTVCRNGGDEFLYLLVDPQGRDNVERIAINVSERLAHPIFWENVQLEVCASIGVALYPTDGITGEDLIRSADAAMYLAKKNRSGFAFAEAVASAEGS